jgi:hypothetical protein
LSRAFLKDSWFSFFEGSAMKRLFWNKHTKRLLKHAAGWFCIAAGLIMLITPGQGLLSILIGVYLLADEIPFFGRIKAWLEHRFPKTAQFVHKKGEQMHARFHDRKTTDR